MIKMHSFRILLGGFVAVVLSGTASRAEDFSVDLTRLAETDATQPLPGYKLDRVLNRSGGDRGEGMPEKTFDVLIHFNEFGNVRLAEASEAGPSTGTYWKKKDIIFRYGLANLADVKTGWIKDSPNLFVVAWVNEPDRRGNGNIYGHGYAILQLQDHRTRVLLRGGASINARVQGGVQVGTLEYPRFSFDARRRLLEERVTRSYERASDRPHNLGHPFKDESGQNIFLASIRETIHLTYKLANGKLLPGRCSLVYKAQKQDELSEVVHFYLGPYATRSALLEANPTLAMKYKDEPPGALMFLEEGIEVRVPVPDEWLIDHFGHGLARDQGKGPGERGE